MTEIEYNGKIYSYSWFSIILFVVMVPIIFFITMSLIEIGWQVLQYPSISQTVWVTNLFTNMGLTIDFYMHEGVFIYYQIIVPVQGPIRFETTCTGLQVTAIFAAIFLMTPHSKDPEANKDIWKRKTISFVTASLLFHTVNILRMFLQITLYWHGADWNIIHIPIGAASSFIAVIIILLMHRWLPEFILSIMWLSGEIRTVIINRKQTKIQNKDSDQTLVPSINETDKKY